MYCPRRKLIFFMSDNVKKKSIVVKNDMFLIMYLNVFLFSRHFVSFFFDKMSYCECSCYCHSCVFYRLRVQSTIYRYILISFILHGRCRCLPPARDSLFFLFSSSTITTNVFLINTHTYKKILRLLLLLISVVVIIFFLFGK